MYGACTTFARWESCMCHRFAAAFCTLLLFPLASVLRGQSPVQVWDTALNFGAQTIGMSTVFRSFAAGGTIGGTGVGDVNGDGNLDLVVANPLSNGISVLLGKGDGTFGAPTGYPAGTWPNGRIVVADFNGDGKPDIAVANQTSNNVSILLNNGNGTFTAGASYANFPSAFSVVAADFNGDGKLDLAVAASTNSPVLLGNGDGTFTRAPASAAVSYYGVAVADMNGDGKPDLISISPSVVYPGNGDGTFGVGIPFTLAQSSAIFPSAGDFNGDGKQDVATAIRSSNPSAGVQVAMGNGDGTLQTGVAYPAGGFFEWATTAADLNGDGVADLIGVEDVSPILSVLLGQRGGPPAPRANYGPFPTQGSPAVVGDFNKDGNPDIAVSTGSAVAILTGRGDGSFIAPRAVVISNTTNTVASITGMAISGPNASEFLVYQSNCNYSLGATGTLEGCAIEVAFTPTGAGARTATLTITDSTGGQFSVALSGQGVALPATVTLNNLTQTYSGLPLTPTATTNPAGLATAWTGAPDTNTGSYPVMATVTDPSYHGSASGTFTIAQAQPVFSNLTPSQTISYGTPAITLTGTISASCGASCTVYPPASDSFAVVINGVTAAPGKPLVGANGQFSISLATGSVPPSSTPYTITYSYGGDQNFAAATDSSTTLTVQGVPAVSLSTSSLSFADVPVGSSGTAPSIGGAPSWTVTGDFNGDGRPDLAVSAGDQNYVLLNNGDGTFTAGLHYAVGSYTRSMAAGDFNGDGKLDLVSPAYFGGTLNVLLGNGDGTFTPAPSTSIGGYALSIAVADFNGDGKADVFISFANGSGAAIYWGNGDGTFHGPTTIYGPIAFALQVADVNHDGRPDVVSPNIYGNRSPAVYLNMGGGNLQLFPMPAVSTDTWSVAVADFNGDGKPDAAFGAYGGNTVWVYPGNGDGTFGTPAAVSVYGNPNISLSAGDLNGDGKEDLLAMYNGGPAVISVLPGNGNGTFGAPMDYAGSGYGAVTDFNGDGRTDAFVGGALLLQGTSGALRGDRAVVITNTGSANVTVSGAGISGANSGDFILSNGCTLIAPGQVCVIDVHFQPSAVGVRTAVLTVVDNTATSPHMITLTGTGTPTQTISFGALANQTYGTASFTVSATASSGLPVGFNSQTGSVCTVSGATVTLVSAGTCTIQATQAGNGSYAAATPVTQSFQVTPAATSVALSSSLNPAVYGQEVTLTAAVSSAAGTPGGSVTFADGGAALGSAPLNGSGQAALAVQLAAGSHSVTATYGGSTNFAGSTSAGVVESIGTASTTVSLSSSPNPSVSGRTVNFVATATSQYGGSVSGTITFKQGANTVLGTATLVNGSATLPLSTLGVGPHSVTAVYGGDTNNTGSTSPAVTQQVAAPSPTTTTLASSLNPADVTQTVTFTAVVSSSAAGTPSGTVTFRSGKSTVLGTAALSGGQAVFSTSSLPAGSLGITAVYSGDSTFAGSTSATLMQTVNAATTAAVLSSAPNPSSAGQAVTFSVSVTSSLGIVPTGTVTLKEGNTALGTGTLDASGNANVILSTLSAGKHNLRAVYSGDADCTASTSNTIQQVVN
jgi:Bacterial Ig-like domain (group 3)/MBG domain/FG-GAP-like repeat